MAFPKFHGIQLANNSWVENLHIERLAADPALNASSFAGRFWFNTTDKVVRYTALDAEGVVVVKTVADAAGIQSLISTLQSTLESSIAATQGEVDAVETALAAETAARVAAITALQTALDDAIAQEVVDRNAAIAVAAQNAADQLATETTARLAGDSAASTRMDGIQSELNATQAGAGLAVDGTYIPLTGSNYLDAATSLAQAQTLLDSALKTEETARIATDAALQSAINNEAQARADGDTALQTQIEAWVEAQLQGNANADLAEQAARLAADTALQTELDATQASIGLNSDGTFAAIEGSNYMDAATTVYGAAAALDLNLKRVDDALVTETAARQAEDATLTAAVAAETLARTTADTALQEEVNRIEAGAGLETDGTYLAVTGSNYLNAATSLKDADLKLDTAIKSEEQRAVAVEAGLQTQIDAITAASGEGAAALKTAINDGRFSLETTVAATEHTVTHNLGTDFIHYTILVKGTDNKWRNDIVPVEVVNNNSFVVSLTEPRNIRVVVMDGSQLV